jgi:hypothetical protein
MIRGYRKTFVHQEESRKADKEIGEIDLLGLDIADRPWVVELKVAPNTDTPLKTLYQGLRYSAIVDLHADGKGRPIDPLKIGSGQQGFIRSVAVGAMQEWVNDVRLRECCGVPDNPQGSARLELDARRGGPWRHASGGHCCFR